MTENITPFPTPEERAQRNMEKVQTEVKDFIESQGYFMHTIESDTEKIRFQIFTKPDGFPLTRDQGLEDVMNAIGVHCDSVIGNRIELVKLGTSASNIVISLDKGASSEVPSE